MSPTPARPASRLAPILLTLIIPPILSILFVLLVPGLPQRAGRAVLGWLFQRLYAELAGLYDPASWLVSGGRWRDWQRAAYPYLTAEPILEIGPGPGHTLAELLAQGRDVVALERSPAMLARCQRRLRRAGLPARLVRGDALALPFPAGHFGCVVLTFPAGFYREARFHAEVARVLRPGGRLVVVEGAAAERWPWPGLLEWALGWLGGPGEPTTAELWGELVAERRVVRGPAGRVWLLVATRH